LWLAARHQLKLSFHLGLDSIADRIAQQGFGCICGQITTFELVSACLSDGGFEFDIPFKKKIVRMDFARSVGYSFPNKDK